MEILINSWAYFLPILVAAAAGGLIGIEREYRDKSAGFRTMILIAVGSCLFTQMSQILGGPEGESTRIAAAVVTGIGFLGAGVILKDGFHIKGMTTAAAIWVVASLGMTAGIGQFWLVGAVTVLILLVLLALPPFERWVGKLYEFRTIDLTIKNSDDAEDDVLAIFDELKIKVVHISRTRIEKTERTIHVMAKMNPAKRKDLSEILVNEKGVLKFSV